MQNTPANLADHFFENLAVRTNKIALIEPLQWSLESVTNEKIWTYPEFATLVEKYMHQLNKRGMQVGDRVLILLAPSARLYALLAAAFACGLIPVFIDHTMKRRQFLTALRQARPKMVFSTGRLFKYRWFIRSLWHVQKFTLDEKSSIDDWSDCESDPYEFTPRPRLQPESTGLISFTSGSSGTPKAADRPLKLLWHQREIGHTLWGEGEIELTAFPMAVLANLVYGITTVLPAGNPGSCGFGVRISNQIRTHLVQRLAVSPSALDKLSGELPSLRKVVTGGAPVPKWLIEKSLARIPNAQGFVLYGSTEAEPIAFVKFEDILEASDHGYLVGNPIQEIQIRILDNGEILLRGPHVVERYLFNDEENRSTKIRDEAGQVWHRTRDLGHFDDQGRLWLTGRLDMDAVYPLEHRFENQIRGRVAAVKDRHQRWHLYLEGQMTDELKELPTGARLHARSSLPVDRRHFWKIDRNALKPGRLSLWGFVTNVNRLMNLGDKRPV